LIYMTQRVQTRLVGGVPRVVVRACKTVATLQAPCGCGGGPIDCLPVTGCGNSVTFPSSQPCRCHNLDAAQFATLTPGIAYSPEFVAFTQREAWDSNGVTEVQTRSRRGINGACGRRSILAPARFIGQTREIGYVWTLNSCNYGGVRSIDDFYYYADRVVRRRCDRRFLSPPCGEWTCFTSQAVNNQRAIFQATYDNLLAAAQPDYVLDQSASIASSVVYSRRYASTVACGSRFEAQTRFERIDGVMRPTQALTAEFAHFPLAPCAADNACPGCCLPGGVCSNMPRARCLAAGGSPLNTACRSGLDCARRGCCVRPPGATGPDSAICLDLDVQTCAFFGGEVLGGLCADVSAASGCGCSPPAASVTQAARVAASDWTMALEPVVPIDNAAAWEYQPPGWGALGGDPCDGAWPQPPAARGLWVPAGLARLQEPEEAIEPPLVGGGGGPLRPSGAGAGGGAGGGCGTCGGDGGL
jgi:hypothetical protein